MANAINWAVAEDNALREYEAAKKRTVNAYHEGDFEAIRKGREAIVRTSVTLKSIRNARRAQEV